jgi:hypothetical protein
MFGTSNDERIYPHVAQLKTFVSTPARRSIFRLKTAMAVFSHVFAALYL